MKLTPEQIKAVGKAMSFEQWQMVVNIAKMSQRIGFTPEEAAMICCGKNPEKSREHS